MKNDNMNRRDLLKIGAATMGGLLVASHWTGRALASQEEISGAVAPSMRLLDFQKLTTALDFWTELPAMASDGRGHAWLVSLQHLPGDCERVIVHSFDGQWSNPEVATVANGLYDEPAIACAPGGRPMLAWVRNEGDEWFIETCLHDGKHFGKAFRVPAGRGRATHLRLVAGSGGRYVLAWEAYENGRFGICLQAGREGKWPGKTVSLVDTRNRYEPAIVLTDDGLLYLAFSRSNGPHRNIHLRKFEVAANDELKAVAVSKGGLEMPVFVGNKAGKDIPIINNYPDMGLDASGDLWLSCEMREPVKANAAYFGERVCPTVRYKDGLLEEIAVPAEGYSGRQALCGNDHFPTFFRDGQGRFWLFGRTFLPNRTWNLRATCLEKGKGWSAPVALLEEQRFGRKGRPAVVALDDDSILVAWQSDNWFNYNGKGVKAEDTTCGLCVARIALAGSGDEKAPMKMAAAVMGKMPMRPVGRAYVPRRTITCNGEEFTLLYGNLHEHSDLSRCWSDGSDGTLDDNYRYGMDVEGYDFVGLTDHGFDLYETAWRQSRRRTKFYNQPPYFVAVPAYEWTLSAATMGKLGTCPDGSGHRNVIFASDEDAARLVRDGKAIFNCFSKETNRIDKLWAVLRERGIRAVTIPHHPVDSQHPLSWNYGDPDIESVLEIYQCRGSAEYPGCPGEGPAKRLFGDPACYADAALRRGRRIGFIASGDHNSMGIGLAALYVREISQAGIVEALKARRCFGTMGDKIFIDFRVDGHLMGQEFPSKGKPRLTALIETPAPLSQVTLFKNSKPLKEFEGDAIKDPRRFELDFSDNSFDADAWYYVRAIQKNQQIAWASPVWVNKA